MAAELTSAAGILALLDEPETELQEYALDKLNAMVDTFWAEIADHIDRIEILYEDEGFKSRGLASLVASKVYYHLGELDDAMTYALGAGADFDVGLHNEYVHTIIARCIDTYSAAQQSTEDADRQDSAALLSVVERMFERCFASKEYKQAAGIAFETRRLDILEKAITTSSDVNGMLDYCFNVTMTLITNRAFADQVLKLLARLYGALPEPGYLRMCQCYIYLGDSAATAEMLSTLIKAGEEAVAFQMAFDLYDSATQQFLTIVRNELNPKPAVPEPEAAGDAAPDAEVPDAPAAEAGAEVTPDPNAATIEKVDKVLSGDLTLEFTVEFLSRNNHSDELLLNNIKDAAGRHSIAHNATVICNSLMHAGTTKIQFLSDNVDWIKIANNWAKFNLAASLGVINKGYTAGAMSVLQDYLPKEGGVSDPYVNGGALYALGLIFANHGDEITQYLTQKLESPGITEVAQHGGCLGLGLASMGSGRKDIYQKLRDVCFADSAVAGEASSIAMGLVMLGSGNGEAIDELLNYARDTKHEKIIRGLAIGLALMMYGKQDDADTLIAELSNDKDAILRMGAVHMIATAYVGTGANRIVKKLLHISVSDVSDDVRRSAVIAMAFVLCRAPEQLPSTVMLLCESFNPHVRYGSAMALGIAFAGTGNAVALSLIEPLLKDSVGFVRQGAMIAMALTMMQQPAAHPKFKMMHETFTKTQQNKHEDILAKFGAIYAQGIAMGGGQNVTCSLVNKQGHVRMQSAVGMLVFSQFWFWFPLGHFISLAMTPTAVICVNKDLQMPRVELRSNAPPSKFAYPPATEPPKEKSKDKVETAVLSTTAKVGAAKKKADAAADGDGAAPMETEGDASDAKAEDASTEVGDGKKEGGDNKEEKKEEPKGPEPKFTILSNPARVVDAQFKVLELPKECRYTPVAKSLSFVTVLCDTDPDAPEEIVERTVAITGLDGGEEEEEADAPEPFEFKEELEE